MVFGEGLFRGVNCQEYGGLAYLFKEYERLCSISLICHVAQLSKLFKSELNYKEKYKKNVIEYFSRDNNLKSGDIRKYQLYYRRRNMYRFFKKFIL